MVKRVFITQTEDHRDFSAARTYGTLVPLVAKEQFPDNYDMIRVRMIMERKLKTFDPARDSLLLSGDPILMVAASAAICAQGVTHFRCLKWDKRERGYFPVTVTL